VPEKWLESGSKMCPLSDVMQILKKRTRKWRKWHFGQYLL